jgi:hypothetical protein
MLLTPPLHPALAFLGSFCCRLEPRVPTPRQEVGSVVDGSSSRSCENRHEGRSIYDGRGTDDGDKVRAPYSRRRC